MSKKKCDHIVVFHAGHSAVKESQLKQQIKDQGKPEDWCCGGGMELNFCPECGKKLKT